MGAAGIPNQLLITAPLGQPPKVILIPFQVWEPLLHGVDNTREISEISELEKEKSELGIVR